MAFIPWPESFTSHYEVSAYRSKVYLDGVRDGDFVPFSFPLFWYGVLLLFLHLMVPTRQGRLARLFTFSLSVAFHAWLILRCRAWGPGSGFAIGMISTWNIVWAAVTLIWRDAKQEFLRVKQETGGKGGQDSAAPNTSAKGNGIHIHCGNGQAGQGKHNGNGRPSSTTRRGDTYRWESFPQQGFGDRFAWAADLTLSFKGLGWNWGISGVPARPPAIEASLKSIDLVQAIEEDRPISSTGRARFDSTRAFIQHNISTVLVSYLILDVLKTIMNHDPYFWGVIHHPPPEYLPSFIRESAQVTRLYRTFVSIAFLWAGLRTFFALGPLLCVGVLGRLLGTSGESWMYPDAYGKYVSCLDRGLAGWWGGWWHQNFRFGFQSGGKWLARDVLRLSKKNPLTAVVELSTSFNISGLMHAAASYTMIGNTNPWKGPGLFFALQPIGIIAGIAVTHLLKQSKVGRGVPRLAVWIANGIFVHVWLALTVPLLVDDLARGGMMLWEPVPLSPLRGLGFGAPGDQLYCWGDAKLAWHQDKHWWKSGITM